MSTRLASSGSTEDQLAAVRVYSNCTIDHVQLQRLGVHVVIPRVWFRAWLSRHLLKCLSSHAQALQALSQREKHLAQREEQLSQRDEQVTLAARLAIA